MTYKFWIEELVNWAETTAVTALLARANFARCALEISVLKACYFELLYLKFHVSVSLCIEFLVNEAELLHAWENLIGKELPVIRIIIQALIFQQR